MGDEVVRLRSDVGSYEIIFPEGEYLLRRAQATGRPYEEAILRLGVSLTKPGDHVLDIGANIGNHTIYWALAERTVTAFEPHPVTAEFLTRNVERNDVGDRVTVMRCALGRMEQTGSLRQATSGNLGSVAVEPGGGEIPISPLDGLDVRPARLVKLDIEGLEGDVVAGAEQYLSAHRPWVIAEGAGARDGLRRLGYHRVPMNLALTPTFLYAPGRAALATAAPGLLGAAVARLRNRQ